MIHTLRTIGDVSSSEISRFLNTKRGVHDALLNVASYLELLIDDLYLLFKLLYFCMLELIRLSNARGVIALTYLIFSLAMITLQGKTSRALLDPPVERHINPRFW